MARLSLLLLVLGMSSSTALHLRSEMMQEAKNALHQAQAQKAQQIVSNVLAESEKRCLLDDVDGSTLNMIKWWNKDLPKLTQDQSIRLLDACVRQQRDYDKDTTLGHWLEGCVTSKKDCQSPPITSLMEKESQNLKNRQKIQSGLGKLYGPYNRHVGEHAHPERAEPDDRVAVQVDGPGVWVRGCAWCNIAANIAYSCEPGYDRSCLIKDDPIWGGIDKLIFEKILPKLLAKSAPAPTPEPPASLRPKVLDHDHVPEAKDLDYYHPGHNHPDEDDDKDGKKEEADHLRIAMTGRKAFVKDHTHGGDDRNEHRKDPSHDKKSANHGHDHR